MHGTGRDYGRIYAGVRRGRVHEFVEAAVVAAGGRVLFSSGPGVAPLFLAIEDPSGARFGVVAYVFLVNNPLTKNRPVDENRGQIRYGDVNDKAWREEDHALGFDPTGLDLTLTLCVHLDKGLIIGLDPAEYDPLPIGNSIYFKDADVGAAQATGWSVWERETLGGVKKARGKASGDEAAHQPGLETVVAFKPEWWFDYLRVEREAQSLGLDSALRYRVAERVGADGLVADSGGRGAGSRPGSSAAPLGLHELEQAYGLSSREVLDIVSENRRLAMAVRGGVAERHLETALTAAGFDARPGRQEGPPDFFVTLQDGRKLTVECKNASPRRYADGDAKVEVQKTRASKNDPASRFYEVTAFDVVAACMYGPTGDWTFRFRRTALLDPHREFAGRLAPLQRIGPEWADSLEGALTQPLPELTLPLS